MISFSQLDSALEATADLERCARFLDLEDWIVMRLRQCEQEITLNTTKGARPLSVLWVRHCTALGPAAVSLQLANDATSPDERARAMQSTWMSALYGLDFGGGSATILVNPREHSEAELRSLLQRVGSSISEIAGPSVFYPRSLNLAEMQWLSGQNQQRGTNSEELAFGLLELIRCAAGRLKALRIAVQGFDLTCRSLMRQLHTAGARIVAVADPSGGLRDPLGLDPTALATHERQSGMLLGYAGAEAVVNSDILEADCDVLVLASGAHQVGPQNASRVRARVLLEASPQSINPETKTDLSSVGRVIVPDLLCGGLTPLYYCTAPDRARLASSPRPFLRRTIRQSWGKLHDAAVKWQLPLPTAAEMLAVQRVAEAIRVAGN